MFKELFQHYMLELKAMGNVAELLNIDCNQYLILILFFYSFLFEYRSCCFLYFLRDWFDILYSIAFFKE